MIKFHHNIPVQTATENYNLTQSPLSPLSHVSPAKPSKFYNNPSLFLLNNNINLGYNQQSQKAPHIDFVEYCDNVREDSYNIFSLLGKESPQKEEKKRENRYFFGEQDGGGGKHC